MERSPGVRCRATVGSDATVDPVQFDGEAPVEQPAATYRKVDAASISAQLRLINTAVFLSSTGNFGFSDPELPACSADVVATKVFAEAPGHKLSEGDITRVAELCDQLEYWALYESRFPEERSQLLASPDFIPLIVGMLDHSRAPIVMTSLRVLVAAVGNPVTASSIAQRPLLRLLRATEEDSASVDRWAASSLLQVLFDAAQRFPNKVELQTFIVTVTRLIAPSVVEDFLTSDVVASTLTAMNNFPDKTDLLREAVLLFSDTIDLDRRDPEDVPISILYLHVGRIMEHVIKAAGAIPTNSEVTHALVRIILAMARRVENDDELGSTQALPATLGALRHHAKHRDLATDALTALACMTRWLDTFQIKAVLVCVKRVMASVADADVLASCCAVIHVALNHFERRIKQAIAHYDAANAAMTEDEEAVLYNSTASAVNAEWEKCQAMREYAAEQQLPQLIDIALDHFEESEDLMHTGRAALASLVYQRWPPRIRRRAAAPPPDGASD